MVLRNNSYFSDTELTGFYNRGGVCLQHSKNCILKCHSLRDNRNFKMGRARSQAVGCRLLMPDVRLRSQANPREICFGLGGSETVLPLPVDRVVLFSSFSVIPPMTHIGLHLHVDVARRKNGRNLKSNRKVVTFHKTDSI